MKREKRVDLKRRIYGTPIKITKVNNFNLIRSLFVLFASAKKLFEFESQLIHSSLYHRLLKLRLCVTKMCRVSLIILLFGLFVVGDSSADRSNCKINGTRRVKSKTVYDIENCANTEIELENERASLAIIKAFNNHISRISDDTFKSATGLTIIDLRENKIEQISVGAFKDQGKLKTLYLQQNKLTRIEVGTFDSLTGLKKLWLQNNQLSLIESGLFDKNTKLINLFMDENRIVAIESTVFQNLNQQVNIRLVGNLCSNETFQGNKFDQNFACFKNYELLKPYLKQLESEKKICDDDKSHYKTENDRLKQEKNNDISKFEISLGNCEADKTSINQEKENLAAKLKSKESELNQESGRIRQLESQTEICNKDKSACVTEKNRLNQNLIAKSNDLSTCKRSLSDCETKESSIDREKINLAETLESCNSELTQTLKEKSICTKEKDSKEKALREKSDEVSKVINNLNDCQREKDSTKKSLDDKLSELSNINKTLSDYQRENLVIYRKKENLIELQSCKSKKRSKLIKDKNVNTTLTSSNFWILSGIIGLDLIVFLISIFKIYQLSKGTGI